MTISFSQAFGGGGSSSSRYQRLYISAGTTVNAPFAGICRARVMGAGGAGAYYSSYSGGGNGASVGIVTADIALNDPVVCVVGAGGAAVTVAGNPGNAGGTTSVSWTGVSASIPGGRGGVQNTAPAANANPTGFDNFWLGGLGGASAGGGSGGGGSAPLLHSYNAGFAGGSTTTSGAGGGAGVGGSGGAGSGGSYGAGGGSGGAGVLSVPGTDLAGQTTTSPALVDEYHSRILINVSAGAGIGSSIAGGPGAGGSGSGGGGTAITAVGGFGGGGGGSSGTTAGFAGGAGGTGGGGGGTSASGGSGRGGNAFIVLEFYEV